MKRATLDVGTKKNIKDLTEKIFKIKNAKNLKKKKVSDVVVRVDDGTLYEVSVFLDTSLPHYGHILDISQDENYFDIELVINPLFIKSKKDLYNRLYHEFLHATDPDLTTQQSDEFLNVYATDDGKGYYGTNIEFRAWTGEILEALNNEIIGELNNDTTEEDIEELKLALKNIVAHLTTGFELLPKAKNILTNMSGKNEVPIDLNSILKKVAITHPKLVHLLDPLDEEDFPEYILILNNIKIHNKKSWNHFLNQLKELYYDLFEVLNNFGFD